MPPELAIAFEKARKNRMWFNDHVRELEIYERHRGKYVGAASGELFVADTPEELECLVRGKYPDEVPHVRYIPRENLSRIFPQREMILLATPHCYRVLS
ncbi:MAG TPA: hypothetical protein VN687_19450 [Blastocatellia bacterium]|nr:hypothetical protein [Blastocatellia bacterium]